MERRPGDGRAIEGLGRTETTECLGIVTDGTIQSLVRALCCRLAVPIAIRENRKRKPKTGSCMTPRSPRYGGGARATPWRTGTNMCCAFIIFHACGRVKGASKGKAYVFPGEIDRPRKSLRDYGYSRASYVTLWPSPADCSWRQSLPFHAICHQKCTTTGLDR